MCLIITNIRNKISDVLKPSEDDLLAGLEIVL